MDPLRRDLCRMLELLGRRGFDAPLFLVGGYGLLLRADHVRERDAETLAPIPFPRATEDLDVVLSARVVADAVRMGLVRDVLREIGYEPQEGRENYQWSRIVQHEGMRRRLKVDVLGQVPEDRESLSIRTRRMRPHEFTGLHANPVGEAALIHIRALRLRPCTDQELTVSVPHPFNYLLLKLHALDDRKDDRDMDRGRHHAFDLHQTLAMTTAEEWEQAEQLQQKYRDHPVVERGRRLVENLFGSRESTGSLRLREYLDGAGLDGSRYPLDDFLDDLREMLGAR